jgi:uncharacterized delta-60 repeat protein
MNRALLLASSLLVASLAAADAFAAPGDLDPTFGTGGVVTLPIALHAGGQAVAIQGDGKIVVAGYVTTESSVDMLVVRLDGAGVLDPSFGTGGVVTLPAGVQSIAQAVALQADGKIVVAGGAFVAPDVIEYDLRLARLLPADGQLDATFGTGGIVETPAAATQPGVQAVAIQADGKILAAAEGKPNVTARNPNRDFLVTRYLADGDPDPAFGASGSAVVSMGRRYDLARAILIQGDGAIVAAGYALQGRSARAAFARLTTGGALDATFGRRGRLRLRLGSRISYAEDALLLPDGRILAAGLSVDTSGVVPTASMALAQLTPAGDLDAGFGAGGISLTAPDAPAYHHIRRIVRQADGKIVAAGGISEASPSDVYLARFEADGTFDASFGTGGVVRSSFTVQDCAFAVALQTDGAIVVAGSSVVGNQGRVLVARYLP